MTDYVLYGSQASLFTGKARAYMNWKGVNFVEKSVTPEIMKQIIIPHVGWAVVPVLQMPDGSLVQDTADIIDAVEALSPEPPVIPNSPVQHFASKLLQVYGDQWLTLPAMHYRWNYNEEWIYTEFGRSMAPDAAPEQHYDIGKAMGQKFRSMVPLLGINAETVPAIEASYEAFLGEFSDHLTEHDFLFGGRPSYADFSFYGPLYAHLYRDPESRKIMERVASPVARWVERMREGSADGALLGSNAVPQTLYPLFQRHSKEHIPVLMATRDLFETWAETAEAGAEIPRVLGLTDFEIEGVKGQIIARPFSLFRLQMALDILDGLSSEDRKIAEGFLTSTRAETLIDFKLSRRMERRNCKLCLSAA